jgi:hypothetical protein
MNLQVSGLSIVHAFVSVSGCDRTPPEFREFLSLPVDYQAERLRQMPIDKQLDYYLAATSYVHPPELGLGDMIAEEGAKALQYLVQKLREEKQEHRQIMLMYVFEHMNRFDHNLRDEREALDALRDTTSNMKDHKAEAQRVLADILENRAVDLEKFKQDHRDYFPSDH